MCTHNLCFSKNIKINNFSQINFSIFTAEKILCLLYGRVFIMMSFENRQREAVVHVH